MPLPNADVYLISNNLDKQNQVDFTDSGTQFSVLTSGSRYSFVSTAQTFVREDMRIKLRLNINSQNVIDSGINYVAYRNTNYSNKWYYAYVTAIEYVSNTHTLLTLETDVYQTWLFNHTLTTSYVDREHVEDDTAFLHTLPEGILNVEPIAERTYNAIPFSLTGRTQAEFDSNYVIAIVTSESLKAFGGSYINNYIGGVPQGSSRYYAVESSYLYDAIRQIDEEGEADKVISVYPILRNGVILEQWRDNIYNFRDMPANSFTTSFYVPTNKQLLSEMSVKHNKLLCYPYNYLRLRNSNGSVSDLKLENFKDLRTQGGNTVNFNVYYNANINQSILVNPKGYSIYNSNDNSGFYSMEFNNFIQLPYNSDGYLNYLALNNNSLAMQKFSLVKSAGESIVGKNIGGAVSDAQSAVATYARQVDMDNAPLQQKGLPSGNCELMSGNIGVWLEFMVIPPEKINVISDYFDRYGYNVSAVKIPNLKSRQNWNYIKTKNANIIGNVIYSDKQELSKMYDNGLTIWHSMAALKNYNLPNDIV